MDLLYAVVQASEEAVRLLNVVVSHTLEERLHKMIIKRWLGTRAQKLTKDIGADKKAQPYSSAEYGRIRCGSRGYRCRYRRKSWQQYTATRTSHRLL